MKRRDLNILAHIRGEINLSTRRVNPKGKFSRKTKHKNKRDFLRFFLI